jgi:hypothetical protein
MRVDMSEIGLSKQVQLELEEAAEHSIARKTWNTYASAERLLMAYHKEAGEEYQLPVDEKIVLGFIHWLAYVRGVSAVSISGYLAGIRKMHIVKGLQEPVLRTQMVKMVLEGRKNMEAADRLRRRRQGRQPVTVDIMKVIKNRLLCWQVGSRDKVTVWAVCTLMFHGAFRGAELLCRAAATFDPACNLLREDVTVVDDVRGEGRSMVQVRVKMPKEDRKGEQFVVDVFQNDSDICPVRAVKKWRAATSGAGEDQPAFVFESGWPVTSSNFNAVLRERLEGVLEGIKITSHSFRIGAASRLGELGVSDADIKSVGRWGSRAFETYLRLPRTKRMMVARRMGKED